MHGLSEILNVNNFCYTIDYLKAVDTVKHLQ